LTLSGIDLIDLNSEDFAGLFIIYSAHIKALFHKMASGESDFKSTNMSTDFEAALEETVTVLRSLDMNVDSSLDAEVRVIEATAKTETGIEESILGITELVHYDVRPVDDDSTSVINVQPEFNVSNNNANKETEKVIEDVPTSQSFDMCESYASNLPSDKDCENERWKFEAKAEFKTEAEFLEDNASPDGSGTTYPTIGKLFSNQ